MDRALDVLRVAADDGHYDVDYVGAEAGEAIPDQVDDGDGVAGGEGGGLPRSQLLNDGIACTTEREDLTHSACHLWCPPPFQPSIYPSTFPPMVLS